MLDLYRKFIIRCQIFINYIKFKNRTKKNKQQLTRTAPTIYFDLYDIRQERYYYPLIFSFHELGFNIKIAPNPKFIGHAFSTGQYIYDLPRVVIETEKKCEVALYVTDKKTHLNKLKAHQSIYLNPNVFDNNQKQNIVIPYPMHPISYRFRYFEKFLELRKKRRIIRIIFSGNTERKSYQNPVISQRFHLINRIEIIDTLIEKTSKCHLQIIKRTEDKDGKTGYFNGLSIYLWEWSISHSENLDIRVSDDQWHDFLASSDFFLCCPGIIIPQSHNAIEAMSVGTIPILQYPEYFHPELIDGVNCITFNDKQELIAKVNSLFTMPKDKILSMREAVITYYEKHLHHVTAAKMILSLGKGQHEIFFYNEAE